VERWALGWGAQVEVIAPGELIGGVRASADDVRRIFLFSPSGILPRAAGFISEEKPGPGGVA
jgi:hypothetical protein